MSLPKIEAKVGIQLMANLPSTYYKCLWQFTIDFTIKFTIEKFTDYSGPINVKVGRNKTCKYHDVIFTCLNTRAKHCKLAVNAGAMELMQVLSFPSQDVQSYFYTSSSQMVGADTTYGL